MFLAPFLFIGVVVSGVFFPEHTMVPLNNATLTFVAAPIYAGVCAIDPWTPAPCPPPAQPVAAAHRR